MKAPQSPVGVEGVKFLSGYINEEFIADLRWPRAGAIYKEMASNDAVIGGCLYLIETFIRGAEWKVTTKDATPGGEEARAFVESNMFDMQEQSWDDFICDVLSMLTYGFSFHEIIYKVRRGPLEKDLKFKSKFSDGKIGWQCIPRRAQSTLYNWDFDVSTGRPITFIQDTTSMAGGDRGYVNIPIEGNLVFKTKNDRNNPEGWSLLRRAYRSWYFKRYLEEIEGIGIERNLAGIPVITPDENTDLFNKDDPEMVKLYNWAYTVVSEIRQDKTHGLVKPFGWTLDLLGTSSKTNMDTDVVIRRHESRMAISMLADLVLMGSDRTGSFALADTKQGLFVASLEALIKGICNTLNAYAVPRLFELNGWQLEILPEISTTRLKEPTINEIAALLRSMNIDITKSPELFGYLMRLCSGPDNIDVTKLAPDVAKPVDATEELDENGDPIDPADTAKPTAGTQDSQLEDAVDNQLK